MRTLSDILASSIKQFIDQYDLDVKQKKSRPINETLTTMTDRINNNGRRTKIKKMEDKRR
jgi:hypothetical protein